MKSSQIIQNDLLGKGVISLLLVTGIAFSAATFLILNDDVQQIFASEIESNPTHVCESGLCYIKGAQGSPEQILVQQGEVLSSVQQVSKNEDFSNIQFTKNLPGQEPKMYGNKVSLFAEKDSFIRESVPASNEGSSKVLRIMGTGPTNNRAMVAFDQDEIISLTAGKTLETATLKLYIESNNRNWGDGQFISIHNLETDWQEGTETSAPVSNLIHNENGVTWICPVYGENCSGKWNGGKFNQNPTDSIWISNQVESYWIKFDVTADILVNLNSEENFGWIIMKNDEESSGQINFASRESQSHIPELVMVFSDE